MQLTELVETPTFTRLVTALLTGDEHLALQNLLLTDPQRDALIRSVKELAKEL